MLGTSKEKYDEGRTPLHVAVEVGSCLGIVGSSRSKKWGNGETSIPKQDPTSMHVAVEVGSCVGIVGGVCSIRMSRNIH